MSEIFICNKFANLYLRLYFLSLSHVNSLLFKLAQKTEYSLMQVILTSLKEQAFKPVLDKTFIPYLGIVEIFDF